MLLRHRRFTPGYALVVLGAFALAMAASWMPLSGYIDDRAYDWMFLRQPPTPWPTSSIILGIDEVTFEKMDGQSHMRRIIAEGLERIHDGGPKAVAIDVILSDDPNSPENAALQADREDKESCSIERPHCFDRQMGGSAAALPARCRCLATFTG